MGNVGEAVVARGYALVDAGLEGRVADLAGFEQHRNFAVVEPFSWTKLVVTSPSPGCEFRLRSIRLDCTGRLTHHHRVAFIGGAGI